MFDPSAVNVVDWCMVIHQHAYSYMIKVHSIPWGPMDIFEYNYKYGNQWTTSNTNRQLSITSIAAMVQVTDASRAYIMTSCKQFMMLQVNIRLVIDIRLRLVNNSQSLRLKVNIL